MIRIVALGSPLGDDAAGLEVGHRLAARPPRGVEVSVRDRPGFALVDAIQGADAVLIVDAARGSSDAGQVELGRYDGRRHDTRSPTSSHGAGVAEALALARSLGHLPARVDLLTITAAPGRSPSVGLSSEVRRALAGAERRARTWAAGLASVSPDGGASN